MVEGVHFAYSTWNKDKFADAAVCDFGVAKLVFVSGIGSENTESGQIGFAGDVTAQVTYAYDRIVEILRKSSCELRDVCRIVAYLTDMRHKDAYEAVQHRYFAGLEMPTHTLLEVSSLAWPGMMVEVQATAVRLQR